MADDSVRLRYYGGRGSPDPEYHWLVDGGCTGCPDDVGWEEHAASGECLKCAKAYQCTGYDSASIRKTVNWMEHAASGECEVCADRYARWRPRTATVERAQKMILENFGTYRGTGYDGTPVLWVGNPPRTMAPAWIQGFKNCGLKAKKATVWRNGTTRSLDLVVEIDCPFDHADETGDNFAKVRLRVNPRTGWVSIHEDSCQSCSKAAIERWLITCPGCRRDDPNHVKHYPFNVPTDESPVGRVTEVMGAISEHEPIPGAKATGTHEIGGTVVEITAKEWTPESARDWLDALVREDGSPVIPVEETHREAWNIAKGIDGHPPKAMIEGGHRLRRGTAGNAI